MYLNRAIKFLLPLALPCLTGVRVANAELDASFTDGKTPPTIATSDVAACPYNQICTGDIVLFTMDTDLSPLNRKLLRVLVMVASDASGLNKRYRLLTRFVGSGFRGFYYRVKPGKTYYFKAIYIYRDMVTRKVSSFTSDVYYQSRDDVLYPGGTGAEGLISSSETKSMGLPPIPQCSSMKSPGEFCTNQVVHVFWNNDRGQGKSVLDIDLYINGQHVKHGNGPEYRGHFQDFYYTLPESSYIGVSVNFQVTWTVRNYRTSWVHYENSQSLLSRYSPGWAYACQLTDSWEECQYHRQEE